MTLSVQQLSIYCAPHTSPLVRNLSFTIHPGEGVALLGESGSGKSLTLLALLRLLPSLRTEGSVLFEGQDLLRLTEPALRRIRGTRISIVFQNAMSALTPTLTLETQLKEALLYHRLANSLEARTQVIEMLHLVELPDPESLLPLYPHQLSGGMRQRVLIAQALLTRPSLLIADEPTTALDALVQSQILALLKSLRHKLNMALLFVTHDLQAAKQVADRGIVLRQGELIEEAPLTTLFTRPLHAYTKQLISLQPSRSVPPMPASHQEPLLVAQRLSKFFATRCAVDQVDLSLQRHQTVALIGESGSGKSTLGRMLIQLEQPTSGELWFQGKRQTYPLKQKELRQQMQMIFQDPFSSLNPRMTLQETLEEPLHIHRHEHKRERVQWMLHKVGLSSSLLTRLPQALSGGQRQRLSIARALILHPALVVCDEPISSLDRPIQTQIIDLLLQLQEEMQLTYFFITHDLEIAQLLAQDAIVMYRGHLLERAAVSTLFSEPLHPYTRALLHKTALPFQKRTAPFRPSGCPFQPFCPSALPKCKDERPVLVQIGKTQQVACHLYPANTTILKWRSS